MTPIFTQKATRWSAKWKWVLDSKEGTSMRQGRLQTSLLTLVPSSPWLTGTQSAPSFPTAAPNCFRQILCSTFNFNTGDGEIGNTQKSKIAIFFPKDEANQLAQENSELGSFQTRF